MTKHKNWLIATSAFLSCAAGPAGSDSDQASFQLRLPLTPVGAAPVQRIRLPLEALIASKSDGLSDIRVFDGTGRVVPIARMPNLPSPILNINLPAMPILGPQKALREPDVTLKIEGEGRVRTVTVDGKPVADDGTNGVIGSLFDTLGHSGDIKQLVLDASIPEGQPVTFTVEASEDLKSWRSLGEAVDYRPPGGVEKDLSIAVTGNLQGGTKLRVTWRSDAQLLTPVIVRQAMISASRAALEAGAIRSISATAPPLLDAYSLEFAVPFAAPIQTIAVDAKGGEGLVPIQILGRNAMEEPWSLLGQGRAEASSSAISLRQRPIRMIRIEADRRVGGFAAVPAVRFGIESPEIAFVTSGKQPFTLAVGHPDAADVYLPIGDIARANPSAIPEASIRDAAIGTLTLSAVSAGSAPKQTMVLWAILLGVTVLLAGIAWQLWSNRNTEAQTPG